jgi:hypothetical protein
MSEGDATDLEHEALEAEAAERDAFEARFPPVAFMHVARTLKIRDPAIFAQLVQFLRDDFYGFYMDCQNKRPSRDAEMKRLGELRDAANLVASNDPWWTPLRPLAEADEEQFATTARQLATFWDEELTKLEGVSSSVGRRSHKEFHDLIIYLIRTYQRVARKPAKKPSTRRNKSGTTASSINSRSPPGIAFEKVCPKRAASSHATKPHWRGR